MGGLFGRLLGAAVQGAGARRAGLNAGEALRVEREKAAAEAARQQQMDLLRMALDQSQIRRNEATAAKASAPPPAPVLHVEGRTLPDTPDGRTEAVKWRAANRAPPRPRAAASGSGGRRASGTPTSAQARAIALRSASGEAATMAAQNNNVGYIRNQLRQRYGGTLQEGEIQGAAQRAYDQYQRARATSAASDEFTPPPPH
jgi:hypothetical protein